MSVIPTELASDRYSRGEGPENLLSAARREAGSDRSTFTDVWTLGWFCGLWSFRLQLLFVNQQRTPCGTGRIRETKTSFVSKFKKLLSNTTQTGSEIKCKIEVSGHQGVTSLSVDNFCARDSEKPCPHMERQGDPGDLDST